jgi:hypothetical protein
MPTPYYVLAASVPPGNRVKGFHQDDGHAPCRILDRVESFRATGFDVSTGDYSKMVDDHWEVRNGDRKLLELYQDGTLLFRVRADEAFLGWGGQNLGVRGWINPVAAVESHASFVHLYRGLIPHLAREPQTVRFSLVLRDAVQGNIRLFLTPYYSLGIENVHEPRRYYVHSADASSELVSSPSAIDDTPNLVAYQLLKHFYELFDAEPSLIPFVTTSPQPIQIDLAAIRSI